MPESNFLAGTNLKDNRGALESGISHQAGRTARTREFRLADEKTYSSTYVGSGTFIISKPKRKRAKLRQSRVKSPQRRARK
jgi:hypothetical protein